MTDKLPINTDSLESIPEAVHSFYTQTDDGKFQLSVDGTLGEPSKLAEFRNNNIQLKQERDQLQSQLDNLTKKVDPAQLEEKKDAQPSDRMTALEAKFAELNQQLAQKDEALVRKTKEDQIRSVSTELGIPATAHLDVINRVMNIKHTMVGEAMTFESFVKDDGTSYTVKDLIDTEIRKVAPHFFINKQGSGRDPKAKEIIQDYKKDERPISKTNQLFQDAFKNG